MNVLLMAPGLLAVLLHFHGRAKAVGYIAYMGAIQLLIGAPFLAHEPLSYISRSFQLNRVFMSSPLPRRARTMHLPARLRRMRHDAHGVQV
jgi:hypothetical protein